MPSLQYVLQCPHIMKTFKFPHLWLVTLSGFSLRILIGNLTILSPLLMQSIKYCPQQRMLFVNQVNL